MMLSLFNDEDILIELGKRYEEIRLEKRLSDADVSLRGGVPTNAIYRFKKKVKELVLQILLRYYVD